jgi:transposase
MAPVKVARRVAATPQSVRRWKEVVEKQGEAGLKAVPHPGPHPRLSSAQKNKLVRSLLEGPRAHGFATELWTLGRVAELIRRKFRESYHPGQVWRILNALGWSCQKPERRARERDEQAIRRWRQKQWPAIKKNRPA